MIWRADSSASAITSIVISFIQAVEAPPARRVVIVVGRVCVIYGTFPPCSTPTDGWMDGWTAKHTILLFNTSLLAAAAHSPSSSSSSIQSACPSLLLFLHHSGSTPERGRRATRSFSAQHIHTPTQTLSHAILCSEEILK